MGASLDLDRRHLIFFARELLVRPRPRALARHAHALKSARWAATLAKFDCRVRVLESRHIASPCTWGVLTPVLLLPTAGDAWSESARHSALLHELAHVQRRDTVSALISRLACALHWYNPLVWLAAAHARNLQERACDDAVLRAGAVPSDYAQFLLDVAAHVSGVARPNRSAIGMAHSSLRARIVAILDPEAMRSQAGRTPMLASCAALFTIAVLLGMASVETAPEPPNAPDPPTCSDRNAAEIADASHAFGATAGAGRAGRACSTCRAGHAGNPRGEPRMMDKKASLATLLGVALLLLLGDAHSEQQSSKLVGLWKAKQWFGPYARGPLLIEKTQSGWTADFAGHVLPVQGNGAELIFALPNAQGSFRGRLERNRIVGHWIAPSSPVNGTSYASPVRLAPDGANRWRGVVTPRDDTFTCT